MNRNILQLGAMLMIGLGVVIVTVSIRDAWNGTHAKIESSPTVAVPTVVTMSIYDVPVVSSFIVEVK